MSLARKNHIALLSHLRALCRILPWLVHLVAADLLLSLLLPFSILFPRRTYDVASDIAGTVWSSIQQIFTRSHHARITISGSPLPPHESAIVVANHVAWTDFYLVQALALRAGMLGRCRWFAKSQLRWVPFLGWGLWAMGMPLVTREWTHDKKELERVFSGIVKHAWPTWLIAYSEATRYSPAKHAETAAWCAANGRPIPRHTLYPRTKGFVATVTQLRRAPHVRAVYDVTVAYARGTAFMAAPSFWETLATPRLDREWRFHVHVERYDMKELPESEEGLAKWLEERWVEKGERLEVLRRRLAKALPWEEYGPEDMEDRRRDAKLPN